MLYSIAVLSGMVQILSASYSLHYHDIAELVRNAELPIGSRLSLFNALNYTLPLGVGCVALLVYTRKLNDMGGVALLFALGLQTAALEVNLRAAKQVFGEETALAAITWWAPK